MPPVECLTLDLLNGRLDGTSTLREQGLVFDTDIVLLTQEIEDREGVFINPGELSPEMSVNSVFSMVMARKMANHHCQDRFKASFSPVFSNF